MYSLSFLPAVRLAVPLFAVWRIRRSQTRELCSRAKSAIQPSSPEEAVPKCVGAQARQLKWVSVNELMTVLTKRSDFMVVDLRADALSVPFPVPTALVLPVSPDELDTKLELLPADRTIAFCGASNLSIFMIITRPCMEGSAPLYVLEGDRHLAEAA
jgi:hypothetical protein